MAAKKKTAKKAKAKAIKKPGLPGRPEIWTDPQAMQAAVNAYFEDCDHTIIIKQHAHSKGITKVKTPEPYTMAGLASALHVSRETLNEYKKDERFSDIIMQARDKVHRQNLTLGLLGCHDSKISALNLASNYGYSTKEEHKIDAGDNIMGLVASMINEKAKNG